MGTTGCDEGCPVSAVDDATLENMRGELNRLRETHRKLLQQARQNPAAGVPEEVKTSLARIRQLQQNIEDLVASSAPHGHEGLMTDVSDPL